LLRYEWDDPVTEREIALGLMKRKEYLENPNLVRVREGFSLLDLKRYAETRGYRGIGLGGLDLNDLITNAPIMVPVNALGYNHFVVFRGMYGNRVLLADPGWGNRTMTTEKFRNMWLDYGQPIGRVGFVVQRTDGHRRLNTLNPRLADFVTLN
jgi:predicted double-glycine peptidase